jgi:hypothetical protein
VRLGIEAGRVVGCLIEKQLMTPQQYPLTLNALVAACNQSSSRDPVVSYDDRTVEQALAWLKDAGLVHFVHPSHGRSVTRYRQAFDELLGLELRPLALLAVLLLRGPQTAGELRARTERMATFDDIVTVEAELEALSTGSEPFVLRLRRRPGQKEERWTQLLTQDAPERVDPAGDPGDQAGLDRAPAHSAGTTASAGHTASGTGAASAADVTALRAEVAALEAEVAALRAAVEQLQARTPY